MNIPAHQKVRTVNGFKTFSVRSVCLLAASTLYGTVFVVVPNDLMNTEGNGGSTFPFFIEYFGRLSSMRYQQVYDASQFSSVGTNGGYITDLIFRADGGSKRTGNIITNVQINLSTTSKSPDGLSSVFSDNVGDDETIVYGPKALTFAGGGGGRQEPLDMFMSLDKPFYYNPSAGNLLLDVRNNTGGMFDPFSQDHSLDASGILGDSISLVYATSVTNSSGTTGTGGLVTGFSIGHPELAIRQATNSVVISWDRGFRVFDLQSSDNLGPQSAWRSITNGIATNAFYQWYTFPLDTAKRAQFFRLSCLTCRGAVVANQAVHKNDSIESISRERKE